MTSSSTPVPSTPAPEHDRIQPVADVPLWSENLVVQVNDGAAGVSVWAHWSRVPGRPDIWEGVLTCYLPGGELLTCRAFGPSPDPATTASNGAAAFRCVEPLRRWRLTFTGMARRVTSAEVAAGVVGDGSVEPLEVELDFAGLHPVWDAGRHVAGAVWASAHLEQGGRITGRVRCGDAWTAIDGYGFRDHSYGPRDYSRLRGNTWVSAVMPGGRVALLLTVWPEAGEPTPMGFVWDGETLHDALAVELPHLESPAGDPDTSDVSITTAAGTERLTVAATHRMHYTLDSPVGMILGSVGTHRSLVTESPAGIEWDGEHADGWYEKNYRIG